MTWLNMGVGARQGQPIHRLTREACGMVRCRKPSVQSIRPSLIFENERIKTSARTEVSHKIEGRCILLATESRGKSRKCWLVGPWRTHPKRYLGPPPHPTFLSKPHATASVLRCYHVYPCNKSPYSRQAPSKLGKWHRVS